MHKPIDVLMSKEIFEFINGNSNFTNVSGEHNHFIPYIFTFKGLMDNKSSSGEETSVKVQMSHISIVPEYIKERLEIVTAESLLLEILSLRENPESTSDEMFQSVKYKNQIDAVWKKFDKYVDKLKNR